jgi:hypothetical protein
MTERLGFETRTRKAQKIHGFQTTSEVVCTAIRGSSQSKRRQLVFDLPNRIFRGWVNPTP